MKLWRAVHARHVATAWSGEGARLVGGRWNSKGRAVTYTATEAATAVIEVLPGLPRETYESYRLLDAEIPDKLVRRVADHELPAGWDAYPHSTAGRTLGDAWLDEAKDLAIDLPSSLIPGRIIAVNPAHRDFEKLRPDPQTHRIPLLKRLKDAP